jgi:hypothetical protein
MPVFGQTGGKDRPRRLGSAILRSRIAIRGSLGRVGVMCLPRGDLTLCISAAIAVDVRAAIPLRC